MQEQYYIYIMTNLNNTVLYTCITGNLERRICEHKEKIVEGFTKRYNLTKLVYYEVFEDVKDAIEREKQIKAGLRKKKVELINSINSKWKDLFEM